MLILAKSVLSLMIGFLASLVLGLIIVPILRRTHINQNVSIYLKDAHKKKDGTPTMGGIIFIIGTFLSIIALLFMKKIDFSPNLFITLFVAVVFFYIYMKSGNDPVLEIYTLNIKIDMGWFYGIFILFVLLAGSNAVNLTDGLDGLAASLSLIAFLALGIIAWGSGWVSGYQDLAIFCFILVGSLFGFLLFNTYPAKVFMGDTGSLALGATLATLAILTDHELTLLFVMGVFVLETLSVIIQVISVKLFHKKVFLMTPLHHHFEKLGYAEPDIVKGFLVVGFLLAMAGIAFGVWI